MTNQEYLKHLEEQRVPTLKDLYEKTFTNRPPSKYLKADIINKLHDHFDSINTVENAKEVTPDEPPAETPEAAPADMSSRTTKEGGPSRRSTIIKMIREGIWDTATLAEALNEINPEWPIAKNKAAVSGTIADLRANKNWTIKIDEKGRIRVTNLGG